MKKRLAVPLLFLTLILGACSRSSFPLLADPLANGDKVTTTSPPAITDMATAKTITETPTYEGCYFTWAYEDLPELTRKTDAALRAIQPNASGRASAFGEDCVYADGHATFGAMQTDFYIRLPVTDLVNEEALGNWIAQVMRIIDQLPRDEVPGGQPGFVEFQFIKSDSEQIIVHVPIKQYQNEAQGKTGIELFRLFYIPPIAPT